MSYVIGIDFGTDSVRAVLVNADDGYVVSQSVHYYSRWKQGRYCNPHKNQFRQHPLDYLEGLETAIRECLAKAGKVKVNEIVGIGVDTTGSTPVAVDRMGTPLSLLTGFEENPNAMFILWKDHTAIAEADEINHFSRSWGGTDYTKYIGGIYSSEWFWAKILHVIRQDRDVATSAYSWLEHCDWIPAVLTGTRDVHQIKRSRCAAGHKAMWHRDWDGLPPTEYLSQLDSGLADLRERLFSETYTSDVPAGHLSREWADRLGLSEKVIVSVGTFDAHAGGLGAEIEPGSLVKVMGTSTCDMMVASNIDFTDKLIRGICGQVDGSVIPGMLGLEAGQSAFGDVLAWFRDVLLWPSMNSDEISPEIKNSIADNLIKDLSDSAAMVPVREDSIIALDWINGRRTPDANQALTGALMGIKMGSDAVLIFKSLVEAICFGSRRIIDRFEEEGIVISEVLGVGGVAKKSPFAMQTLASVLNKPIKIANSDQTPSLGSAMLAATAAGIYKTVEEAKEAMGSGFDITYHPNPQDAKVYSRLYKKYLRLGAFVENETSREP